MYRVPTVPPRHHYGTATVPTPILPHAGHGVRLPRHRDFHQVPPVNIDIVFCFVQNKVASSNQEVNEVYSRVWKASCRALEDGKS